MIRTASSKSSSWSQPLFSAPRPEEWECPQRFDLVLVASLFTHLPYESWTGWLTRLAETLEPGGHMVITTHGLDWLHDVDDDDRAIVRIEGGFRYRRANETSGRLSCDEYGCSYVDPSWVRERAAECGLEEARFFQNALWGQDVWVLRRRDDDE